MPTREPSRAAGDYFVTGATKLVSKVGPSLKPLTFLRRPATSVSCQRKVKGPLSAHLLLDVGIHLGALGRVALEQRVLGLLLQIGRHVPGIAPGERLVHRIVGVVGVGREGLGIRVRIPVVDAPLQDGDVVLAGAVLGQDRLEVAGDDLDLDAGLAGRLLDRLGDARDRLHAAHVHGDGEAVRQARLGQQFLGLGDVELVGLVVDRAEHAGRQEVLVDLADALEQGLADRVVVDQVLEGFAHLGLGEVRVLLVDADVVDRALRRRGDGEVGILPDRRIVAGLQVAGDVDVALFQHQALRGAFLDVAVDDAGERALGAVILVVELQHDRFVGAPFARLVGARAGIAGLQPAIAEIIVELVLVGRRDGGDMLLDQLGVDDRADGRGQAVQHEARRVALVDGEDEGRRIDRLGLLRDVVAGQAELLDDEGRALVELDGALEGPGDVLGGDRVAGGELDAGLQLEGVGQAVVGHGPAFGDAGDHLGRVGRVEAHQHVVGVAGDLAGGQLEGFGRIERDDVVDRPGLDQRVGRASRRGPARRRASWPKVRRRPARAGSVR